MPNLNGAKYLVKALDSFLEQDVSRKELIVVDGKSTDESHSILTSYQSRYSEIRWIRDVDSGLSDAINIGINAAQGDIVGYMGSDDILLGGVFRKIIEFSLKINFDALFFSSYSYYVDENRCELRVPNSHNFGSESLLRHGTIVGLQNVYFKRSVYELAKFNPSNKYSMDYELYLQLSSFKLCWVYADCSATINMFDGNISHNNPRQFDEAVLVTRKYLGDYRGAVWCGDISLGRVTASPPALFSRAIAFTKRLLK